MSEREQHMHGPLRVSTDDDCRLILACEESDRVATLPRLLANGHTDLVAEANAFHLAACWNAFEPGGIVAGLLAACKRAMDDGSHRIDCLLQEGDQGGTCDCGWAEAEGVIRAAIAKAKVQP